eukprot:457888_1
MGALLSDRVTQKIILGVLISFLLLPLFDVGNMDQGEKTFITLEELEFVYSNHHNTTNGDILPSHAMDYDNSLDIFMQYHSDILYLGIASTTGDGFSQVEINEPNDDLRAEEQAEYATESGKSKTILNVRANVQEEAILNICLTTFIMGIFTVGAFVISVDAFMLVYPLEYLVIAIKRLSSIAVHQEKIIQNQNDNKNTTISSTDLFGSIMKSMTDIFYSGKREKLFLDSVQRMQKGNDVKIELKYMIEDASEPLQCDEKEQ